MSVEGIIRMNTVTSWTEGSEMMGTRAISRLRVTRTPSYQKQPGQNRLNRKANIFRNSVSPAIRRPGNLWRTQKTMARKPSGVRALTEAMATMVV